MPAIPSEGCYVYFPPERVRFTTKGEAIEPTPEDAAADLLSRCRAAARLALRGDGYSVEDRDECAATILHQAMGRMPGHPAPRPFTLGTFPLPLKDAAAAVAADRAMRHGRTLPVGSVPFGVLAGNASNFRRSLDRQKRRDSEDAARKAADAFLPDIADTYDGGPQRIRTADASRREALRMLDAIGVRPLRKGDANAYILAYSAARAGTLAALDIQNPAQVCADECGGLKPSAYSNALSRAAKRIPSAVEAAKRMAYGKRAHREALDLPGDEAGLKLKPSRSRTMSADLENEWRTRPDKVAEVTVSYAKPRTDVQRPAWATALVKATPAGLAPSATALRLERAAEIRRERAADRTEADRTMARLSAGLPA